jgi:nicotinamide-nucleotide amidase
MPSPPTERRLLTAELLSIGSELVAGETRDTNAGELARSLTDAGVTVGRMTALPDRLDVVAHAFAAAFERADLVVSTGGLGPTPDDLTREAIAAASDATPAIDPGQEAWLRELWSRRGMPFPELNLKQAWLLPSALPLPNPNGTAPGWLVSRPDGRVIVAMPGPPREMRPMWADHALPQLRSRGLGVDVAARTYRLTGIGESQLADRLGETLLRATNPVVATYARVEAVDVRVSAVAEGRKSAEAMVEETAGTVLDLVGEYVWATGDTTWSQAIGTRLESLGWTLSAVELGTAGAVGGRLGDTAWFRFDESTALDAPAARAHATGQADDAPADAASDDDVGDDLLRFANRARELGGSEIGVAIRARPRTGDTAVSIAVVAPGIERKARRIVFQTGPIGRSRTALAAAAFVLETLNTGSVAD